VDPARAFEVPVAPRTPQIDGVLTEWGLAPGVEVSTGGDGIGVRGAFEGEADHWANIGLMWDADSLYVAVSVIDDVLDVKRIDAGDNVWKGPSGERKDKMFYYDHLKVFLRGPEQPLGFNLWISPDKEGDGAYVWGGQQRGAVSADLPIRVASLAVANVYSYEMALPWSWLRLYPQPDMELDALFLLPDSDLPGLELRKKVVQSNKWIWWKGKVQLKGRPPGLKKKPEPKIIEEIMAHAAQIVVPKVKAAVVPARAESAQIAEVAEVAVRAEGSVATVDEAADNTVGVEAQVSEAPTGQAASSTTSMLALRSRLNRRQLLARAQVAPAWVRDLNKNSEVSTAQVDSLYYRLGETLRRLSNANISSRSDGLVMDMAEYAGTWRAQARSFVIGLLHATLEDIEDEGGRLRPALARAAVDAEVEEKQVVAFMRRLCDQALKVYENNKVVATGDLVDKARRKARLSPQEMQRVLEVLVNHWKS
jgi:hypothetical protein